MAKSYAIADARSHLPTIVDQAQAGQEIELTRRGVAVAVVISLRELARLRGNRAPFGEAYKRFLAMHHLSEDGLDEGELQMAREPATGRKVAL